MKSFETPLHLGILLGVALLFHSVSGICFGFAPAQNEFKLSLNSGTTISVTLEGKKIDWMDVAKDGTINKRTILLKNIKEIELTDTPAGEMIASVKQAIEQLGSEDYHEREAAEESLSRVNIGGPFVDLIELHRNTDNKEIAYRVSRILQTLSPGFMDAPIAPAKFDMVELKDGTSLSGDAGNVSIRFKFDGELLELDRSEIRKISRTTEIPDTNRKPSNIETQLFHLPGDAFYTPGQIEIGFEQDARGNKLLKSQKINEVFIPLGVRFHCNGNGTVQTSSYQIRDTKPGGSPGVTKPDGDLFDQTACATEPRPFQGILMADFCLPGQGEVVAGVNEVGLVLSDVNHSRDIIMEALNVDGNLIALVEASNLTCNFFGVKSTEPIVKIRLLSNPHLKRLDRSKSIDKDFAIDNFVFSKPIALPSRFGRSGNTVLLRNGDRLAAKSIKWGKDGNLIAEIPGIGTKSFATDKIKSVQMDQKGFGANSRIGKGTNWKALLSDGSLIHIKPGKDPQPASLTGVEINQDNIVAMTAVENAFRYPLLEDFEKGKQVLVFPTCRIATNKIMFGDKDFLWDEGAVKIEQELNLRDDIEEKSEDPTPRYKLIRYSDRVVENIPTIWFGEPKNRDESLGFIRFRDGQVLVVKGELGISITALGNERLTVNWKDQELSFPWEKIETIQFPE